jgi:predicted secreted Zn-dependent protease
MRLFNYLFIACLLLNYPSFGQRKDDVVIDWSAARKLTWADYWAEPDTESDAAASTTTYLGIEYKIAETKFSFKIESTFSKKRSWGLHKTSYILIHEQGHFDIAEIFARQLNKRMKAYHFNQKTIREDLNKIYQNILDEKEDMQNNYDKETQHSINKEKQKEWLKKIALLLKEYEAYATY